MGSRKVDCCLNSISSCFQDIGL